MLYFSLPGGRRGEVMKGKKENHNFLPLHSPLHPQERGGEGKKKEGSIKGGREGKVVTILHSFFSLYLARREERKKRKEGKEAMLRAPPYGPFRKEKGKKKRRKKKKRRASPRAALFALGKERKKRGKKGGGGRGVANSPYFLRFL